MKKIISCFILLTILTVPSFTKAEVLPDKNQNNTINSNSEKTIFENAIFENTRKVSNNIYEVIDCEKVAMEHDIPLFEDGKPIKKIEIEYVPSENGNDPPIENDNVQSKNIFHYVDRTKNCGSGWSNADTDLFADLTTSGPDTLVISKTDSFFATRSGEVGVSDSGISAKVGFEIGSAYSVTYSSTTPVARGETLNVKAYTSFLKIECYIYSAWDGAFIGITDAFKPNGAIFVKTWY